MIAAVGDDRTPRLGLFALGLLIAHALILLTAGAPMRLLLAQGGWLATMALLFFASLQIEPVQPAARRGLLAAATATIVGMAGNALGMALAPALGHEHALFMLCVALLAGIAAGWASCLRVLCGWQAAIGGLYAAGSHVALITTFERLQYGNASSILDRHPQSLLLAPALWVGAVLVRYLWRLRR